MDGKTALQEIRSHDTTKDTSVVVCSALSHDELVMELAKLGLNGYIVKPFNRATAKMKIEKALKALL
jgi:two-component system chemotaxis response regulator CheY